MRNEKQLRLMLSISSIMVVFFSVLFVMIISNIIMTEMLVLLCIIAMMYIIVMCAYFQKGEIFEDDGSLRDEVYIVLIAIPVILLLMFGFLNFAFQEINLRHTVLGENEQLYMKGIGSIVIEIFTVVVLSVLFTIELIFFLIQIIRVEKNNSLNIGHYIRQIAFMYFFASSMSSSFIPIMAKNLVGTGASYLIGLPQSATFLCTCFAILIFTKIANSFGMKPPFIVGACVFIVGVILSIASNSIIIFIVARGIVGIGYGLCWMTLRCLSIQSENESERNACFSSLNAGIYAGIICGSVFGSILVQNFHNTTLVFILAITITIITVSFVAKLKNSYYSQVKLQVSAIRVRLGDIVFMCAFVLIMIFPSCIVESFLGYYFPLWINENYLKFTDIGRAQLAYGICIVHLGPLLTRYVKIKSKNANILYNIILGFSLLLFFFAPNPLTGIIMCAIIGLADSFGFVFQNNLFLNLKVSKKLGKSQAMSLLSFSKKIAASFGPLIFGLVFAFGNGLLFLGTIIMGLSFLFVFLKENESL